MITEMITKMIDYCKRRNVRAVHISRSALDARKYDVSEEMKHYRSNRIDYEMRENVSTRKCHIGLDAQKFSCAKISTFTVSMPTFPPDAPSGVRVGAALPHYESSTRLLLLRPRRGPDRLSKT